MMETINNIELRDAEIYPDDEILIPILKDSFPAYRKLLELFDRNEMNYEWRYYNDGKAWLCKVLKKKKTIVWMSAWLGYMQATIYFPARYIDSIYELDISQEMKESFILTKSVGKSKPFIFKITDKNPLKDFEIVMKYKLLCK